MIRNFGNYNWKIPVTAINLDVVVRKMFTKSIFHDTDRKRERKGKM